MSFDCSCSFVNDFLIWIGKRGINLLGFLNTNKDRIHLYDTFITDEGLLCLSRYDSCLQTLNISGCKKITDSALIEIGKNCTNLRSLNTTI